MASLSFVFQVTHTLFNSDRMKEIVERVVRAVDSAAETSNLEIVWGVLHILNQLEERPRGLEHQAYRWCIMIWRNRDSYKDWKTLLLLSLEVSVRRSYSSGWPFSNPFTGGEIHQGVYETVLESNNNEAVTDLVAASSMFDESDGLVLRICADYIVDRHGSIEPFSKHLRNFFASSVARTGFDALEKVGKERFVELLNRLHIGIEEARGLDSSSVWAAILLQLIRSTEARRLDTHSWELLAELGGRLGILSPLVYVYESPGEVNPVSLVDIEGWEKLGLATSLMDAEEWDKLECWMSIFWIVWPVEAGNVTKELEDVMQALEKQRPGALRRRMERRKELQHWGLYGSYQQTFDNLTT